MHKFFLQYRTTLAVALLGILALLLLSTHYGLMTLPSWTQQIIPGKSVSVKATTLGTSNKPIKLLRTGSVESPKSAPIQTEFPGRISEVYVTEGQVVKTNQPLVKITRTTNNGENPTPSYQNEETSPQAQINYDNAQKDYNRFQKLYEQGAIAKRQLDIAEMRLQTAAALLGGSSPVVPHEVQSPQNNVAQASNSVISINAINPGVVTGLSAVVGKWVEPGQQLMVVDVGEVQVVIHVEQKDLYLLHPGTQASVEIAGQTILGQVAGIYPEVGTNNVSSFRTHINIPTNTGGLLKTGMSVNVGITTSKSEAVHTLPTSAILRTEQGTAYIYLIDNGKAKRQDVTLGETIGDVIEITSALPEQALIATSNTTLLTDGDHIIVEK